MRASDCSSELLVVARRRALTSTETLALRTHLVECESCRLAQQLGEDLQQETAVTWPTTAPPFCAWSEVARRWARQSDRRRGAFGVRVWHPVRIAAMAASLVLIAGTVSAVWLWRRPPAAQSSPKSCGDRACSPRAAVPARCAGGEPPPDTAAGSAGAAASIAARRCATRLPSAVRDAAPSACYGGPAPRRRRAGDHPVPPAPASVPDVVGGGAVGRAAGRAASGTRRRLAGVGAVRSLPARGADRSSGARGAVRPRACHAYVGRVGRKSGGRGVVWWMPSPTAPTLRWRGDVSQICSERRATLVGDGGDAAGFGEAPVIAAPSALRPSGRHR